VAAAITLIGAATWAFVIRDVREVSWREEGWDEIHPDPRAAQ
jgi:hypothetical protein